jgi:hypothetical protein
MDSVGNMPVRSKINSFFGLCAACLTALAGGVLSMFGKPPAKPAADALRQMEFKTSTQHLGVRFTEKIRQVFRFRWLKKF